MVDTAEKFPVRPADYVRADTNGLGVSLKEARKRAKLTQAELARKSGISLRTINALERGWERGTPRWDTQCALAYALGVHVLALLW